MLMTKHMVVSGYWCLHQYRYLCKEASYETLFYLANFRRYPRPETNHGKFLSHSHCILNNVNESTYKTLHTQAGCFCPPVEAPTTKLHQILREGGIPVLKYRQDSSGIPTIDCVWATPGAKYAAISHLWADGIGNP